MPLSLTHFRYLGRFLIYAICPTFQLTWQSDTEDRTRESGGVVIAPVWTTQSWFTKLLNVISEDSFIFTKNAKSLDTSRKSRKTTSS